MLIASSNPISNSIRFSYNFKMRLGIWRSLLLICCVLAFTAAALAQKNSLPDAPNPQPAQAISPKTNAIVTVKNDTGQTITQTNDSEEPPASHAFWDKENILLFTGVGVFRGLDYASTRNMQARGRREILLADAVVNNSAAFASLEAAGTMTSVGISYIFHRTGHHTLERWMSISHISVTGFGAARNYALKSKHPQ